MAKGHDRHVARLTEVAGLGKDLSRRAKSKCELCQGHSKLFPVELKPLATEPHVNWAVLICERCANAMDSKKLNLDEDFQFLRESIWSEIEPVQVVAIRLMRQLANQGLSWAQHSLEDLYIDPDIEHR